MFKTFWDGCCKIWNRVDEKLCRRFLYLPIAMIVTSVAVLGILWAEDKFDLAYEKDSLEAIIEEVSEDETSKDKTKTVSVKIEKMKTGDNPIDINMAPAEELQRLPGIGAVRATAIVNQRKKMGGFRTIDDIKCTPGIGEKVFTGLDSFIKINK